MKIVLSVVLAMFLVGCSEDKVASAKEEVVKQTSEAVEVVAQKSQEVVKESKEALEETKEVVTEAVDTTKSATKEVVKEVTVVAKATTAKVVKSVQEVSVDVDGATVFKACSSCHGMSAEKKALNKSQIIKGWESSKVVQALNGYKDGSYGGTMKGVMKPQVVKLNEAQIEAVAKYISTL